MDGPVCFTHGCAHGCVHVSAAVTGAWTSLSSLGVRLSGSRARCACDGTTVAPRVPVCGGEGPGGGLRSRAALSTSEAPTLSSTVSWPLSNFSQRPRPKHTPNSCLQSQQLEYFGPNDLVAVQEKNKNNATIAHIIGKKQ